MTASTVWKLPCKSQEFRDGPVIRQGPDTLNLAYDFETEDGTYAWEEIAFVGVSAFAFTNARSCTEEQIGAYDQLQESPGSTWPTQLREIPPGSRHYRIYFDDVGWYEILAVGFVPPPGT